MLGEDDDESDMLIERSESLRENTKSAKWKYVCFIGLLDATGSVLGLTAQAKISGPLYSLALQTIVFFSAAIGYFFLGTR